MINKGDPVGLSALTSPEHNGNSLFFQRFRKGLFSSLAYAQNLVDLRY